MVTRQQAKYAQSRRNAHKIAEYGAAGIALKDRRLVGTIKADIARLAVCARELPEDLQKDAFGDGLTNFFVALFSFREDCKGEEFELRRKRLLKLSRELLLFIFGDTVLAHKLAPKMTHSLLNAANYDLAIKAVLMETV